MNIKFPQSHGAENPSEARNGQVTNHNIMHASERSRDFIRAFAHTMWRETLRACYSPV